MQVTGIVENIAERTTRIGPMYDVIVNGKKYGSGKYAPRGIKAGDFVSFEVDVKQNGQYTNYDIRKGTIRIEEGTPPAKQEAAPKTTAKTYGSSFGGDNRQEVISKQAALNTALTFCNLAASQGAIPMPKGVKETDKLAIIHSWVLDTAASFYALSTGNKWDLPAAAPATPQKPAAPAKKAAKATAEMEFEDDDIPFDDAGYDEYPDAES